MKDRIATLQNNKLYFLIMVLAVFVLAGCSGATGDKTGSKDPTDGKKQGSSDENSKPKPPEGMIKIPAGEFIMGSNGRHADEGPEMKVHLPEYYIDPFEVTNSDYLKFVKATDRKTPDHWQDGQIPPGRERHPVIYVDWSDAKAYCKWAGKVLPTQAIWEKAARGTKGQWFAWGATFDPSMANTPQTKIGDTVPVGSFPQGDSPYGLSDVTGNVWEWTDEWYLPYPGNASPSSNYGRVYKASKGGSWYDCTFYRCGISAPVFNRAFMLPETRNDSLGLRCAYLPKGQNIANYSTPGATADAGGNKQ